MASIHRKPGSPFWYCAFTDADGKRAFKSTKQVKVSHAWRVAHAYEDMVKAARLGQITEVQMRKVITSTVAKVSEEPVVIHTIRKWFLSWLEDMKQSSAEGTGKRYDGIVNAFLDLLGKKADQDLGMLNKMDVQKFKNLKIKNGLSNSSINLLLKAIRNCLDVAVSQEIIPTNPAKAVRLLRNGKSSKRDFTDEEMRALRNAAPDDEWDGLILVGYYVGGRLRNCSWLGFEQIDFEKNLIRYIPVKQKDCKVPVTLTVPIHPDLQAYLEPRRRKSGFVFPALAQMPIEGESGLSRRFRRIIDAAGVKYQAKKPRGKGGRTSFDVGFHSLRRTFNSRLANAGVSQEIRQRLVGHASEEVNDGYTQMEIETYRQAIEKLPSLGGTAKGTQP